MDAEQAAKLVSDGDAEAAKAFAEKNTALAAAKRGYVDEIIEPQETRQRIAASLQMLGWKSVYRPDKKNGTV
jgi:acetyl-CoA carboxylase carboxyltransferase component